MPHPMRHGGQSGVPLFNFIALDKQPADVSLNLHILGGLTLARGTQF
jgi:hypothetical protein